MPATTNLTPCAVDERQLELPFVPQLPPCTPNVATILSPDVEVSWHDENPLRLPPLSDETKKLLKKFDWD